MRGFAGYFILNVALKQFLEVSNGKVCEEGLMSWEKGEREGGKGHRRQEAGAVKGQQQEKGRQLALPMKGKSLTRAGRTVQ